MIDNLNIYNHYLIITHNILTHLWLHQTLGSDHIPYSAAAAPPPSLVPIQKVSSYPSRNELQYGNERAK